MANKLNMTIAKTHALSARLIGMQLTTGTLLGVALSCIQMMAGFVTIGGYVGIPVGFVLAIMIEKLSLGGLSAVRVAGDALKQLEAWFYTKEAPTEQEQAFFEQRKKKLDRDQRIGWGFGACGLLLSAAIGDTFWHWLYRDMQPELLGLALSICCAAVVGLNFIHGELFKSLIDAVLKTIVVDVSLEKTVVVAEEQNMQINMMIDSYTELQNDVEMQASIQGRIKDVISKRLNGFAREVNLSAEQVDAFGANVIEGSLSAPGGPGQQLMLPAPRGKYGQHRDELRRLLRANPGLTQRDIAKHFSVAPSTANDWLKKLKAGL